MGKYEETKKAILARKSELGTWKAVASTLSIESGESISEALVWKVAKSGTRSPKVARALNMMPTRYRRSAEFPSEEILAAFDAKLEEMNLTLTQLCNMLANGEIRIE